MLRELRALGIRTSIDDFGTGYSAMSYPMVRPVDEVKIGRSSSATQFRRQLPLIPRS